MALKEKVVKLEEDANAMKKEHESEIQILNEKNETLNKALADLQELHKTHCNIFSKKHLIVIFPQNDHFWNQLHFRQIISRTNYSLSRRSSI